MRITIGISVYNRRNFVSACAQALRRVSGIESCELLILNDGSTEFDQDWLASIFPRHAKFIVNAVNGGVASGAALQLYNALALSSSQTIVFLDSDVIASADLLRRIRANMAKTDGFLSLFNADSHAPVGPPAGGLVEKNAVGNAAVAWDSDLLRQFLASYQTPRVIDWTYCSFLRSAGRRVMCLQDSAAQHLGFAMGENSRNMSGDFGLGVAALTAEQAAQMAEAMFLGTKTALLGMGEEIRRLSAKIAGLSLLAKRVVIADLKQGEWIGGATSATLEFVLGEGWGEIEHWGVWSVGPSSHVRLWPVKGNDLLVEIECHAATATLNRTRTFEVMCAGRLIDTWDFAYQDPATIRSFIIPATLIEDEDGLEIAFRNDSGRPVNEVDPGSNDTRALGLGLMRIRQTVVPTGSARAATEDQARRDAEAV